MDLKGFLPNKKSTRKELYWSVIIEPKWVQVGVWRVLEGKAEVIARSSPSAWELDEELVTSIDTALSSAVQELDEDSTEPEKTVFGVVSSWVEEGQIKKKYLDLIKHLCSELSLKPAGFVVLSEAIANLVKSEEGALLSGVIIGVSKEHIEVSAVKQGGLKGTTEVARSISVVEDVVEGLSRFSLGDSVPSRFLLYNSKESELEEVRQALLTANWDDFDNLKFLHTPKIEVVSSQAKLDAVSLAGGIDIADITSLHKPEKEEPDNDDGNVRISEDDNNIEEVGAEELGFAVGEDVAAEDGTLISKEKRVEKTTPKVVQTQQEVQNSTQEMEVETKRKKLKRINISALLGVVSGKLNFLKRREKTPTDTASTGKRALIIGIVILVALFSGAFALWWFLPKATVTVYLSTSQLDERVTVTVDPDAKELNISEGILPGQVFQTEVSGDKTTQATGTKTVGDRATGEVKLFRVGSELSLSADTAIIGPSDFRFTLDESVTIASGSASTPGTATVSVTAEDIGADYNLASGTSFEVDEYSASDVEAKNESDFSGGSSREISAVSEEDQTKLEEDLKEELKNKALDELKLDLDRSDTCTGCVIVEESYASTVTLEEYSAKVGDEASNLELSLAQDVQVVAVNNNDLIALSEELLKDRVPDGFVLRGDQIKVDFEFEEEEDGKYILNASISVNLFPEIDPDEIATRIAGKYPELARDYLVNELQGFVRAEIRLRPKLPGRLGTLPHVDKRIEIEIAAER